MSERAGYVRPDIAFMGTGWIGLNRMKSLINANICNPVAILEPDPANAQRAHLLAPSAEIVVTPEELYELEPDGIVIATPSALHADQCISALENGIAVFCQKPLARSAEECEKIIRTASIVNRLLGVDFSYRLTNGMKRINELRCELGEIFSVDLVFNNAYGPDKSWFYDRYLSGGGCLLDLGVHLIDLALWMLDFPEIKNVSSTLFSKGKIIEDDKADTVEDYVLAQFETLSGTVIRLVCSWNISAGQDSEIKASFYGTKASELFYNVRGSYYDFEAALCRGTSKKIISYPPDEWGGRALINWTRTLQDSRLFSDSAWEYYKIAELIDKIYKRNITTSFEYEMMKQK